MSADELKEKRHICINTDIGVCRRGEGIQCQMEDREESLMKEEKQET